MTAARGTKGGQARARGSERETERQREREREREREKEREGSTMESLARYADTDVALYRAACRPRNRIHRLISDAPSRWSSPGLV